MSEKPTAKIRLQLDSGALAFLIGGDSEVELELRQSVVETFTRKYLKGLVSETLISDAVAEVTRAATNWISLAKQTMTEQIGREGVRWGTATFDFSPEMQKMIKAHISQAYELQVSAYFQEIEANLKAMIDERAKRLEALLTNLVGAKFNAALERTVTELVNQRFAAVVALVKEKDNSQC